LINRSCWHHFWLLYATRERYKQFSWKIISLILSHFIDLLPLLRTARLMIPFQPLICKWIDELYSELLLQRSSNRSNSIEFPNSSVDPVDTFEEKEKLGLIYTYLANFYK
jgi:hypothetical protein